MGLTPLWLSSASAYSCSALLWWSRRLVKMHSLEFGETINEVLSWRGHRRCSLPLGQKSLVVVIYLSGCYGIFPSAQYSSLPNKHPWRLIYCIFSIRHLSWIEPTLAVFSWWGPCRCSFPLGPNLLSGCCGMFASTLYSTLSLKKLGTYLFT